MASKEPLCFPFFCDSPSLWVASLSRSLSLQEWPTIVPCTDNRQGAGMDGLYELGLLVGWNDGISMATLHWFG